MSVVTFPGNWKLCKDHMSLTVAADCAAGEWGDFTAVVQLANAEQFLSVNYSAWANQTGGTYALTGIVFECLPLTGLSFKIRFFNGTGNIIAANTVMDISYAAAGI